MILEFFKQRAIQYLFGALVGALLIITPLAYTKGIAKGKRLCENAHAVTQAAQLQTDLQAKQVQSDKAQTTGTTLAQSTQSIHQKTQRLSKEVMKHETTTTDHTGGCRPSPDGVRIWNEANSNGGTASNTTTERTGTVP